ncbi:hypothetical protein FPV67DRAFT_1559232 [Lyophyllum atratum]|nr:hypothetical protein FPV67DRAFT_1559232 [Lyophyllum atratum]
MRKTDKEILTLLKEKHFDTNVYGLGIVSFRRLRRDRLGLERTRQQKHTLQSIREPMLSLRHQYPKAGAIDMKGLLFHEKGMSVSRSDILAVDQHDKWMRFGLRLHTGIDPFAGRIHWLKVWWTNSNPKLIGGYYLDFINETGHMPLVTQSDPGSENYGIANITTGLRHWHDPNLQGTLQHRWMREKKNVMPEIAWSQMRRRFTPGFEDILEVGAQNEWYDIDQPLDVLVFRWVFIPWLQQELNAYMRRINNSKKRSDRNKILPHGVPNDIYESPERYGCLDFKVKVDPAAVAHIDPVFELVPASFNRFANALYETMHSPVITRDNVWHIYLELHDRFSHLDEAFAYLERWQEVLQPEGNPQYDLLEGQQDLMGGPDDVGENGSYYMGGVNNGHGLGMCFEFFMTCFSLEVSNDPDNSHHTILDDMDGDAEDLVVQFTDDEEELEVEQDLAVRFTDDEYIPTDERDQW